MATHLHFGIDLASSIDAGELTRVANALQPPHFVGRYQPVYAMTAAEVAYIHARDGAILLIDNEDQSGGGLGGSRAAGAAHGARAAQRWQGLGAPHGCAIFLDVEQAFYVAPNYLAGWTDGLVAAGMASGIYLNSVAGNDHNASYRAARQLTSDPIWIFASEPQPYSIANQVATTWAPAAPEGHNDDVVVWQYCINFGESDLDLCTDAGLALMWRSAPTPPSAPPTWHVRVPGALKVGPSHASKVAVDPQHNAVWLEVGATVQPTGSNAHTDDNWLEVKLVKPEQVVHGWYPSASLKKG